MKNFLKSLFFICLAVSMTFASNIPAGAVAALEQFSKNAAIEGNFKQVKHIKKISRNFEATGTFLIANGTGVVWNTEKPFKTSMIITEKQMVQRSVSGAVSKMDASENAIFAEFSKTIQSVFSGNIKSLEEHFTVSAEAVKNTGWKLTLVPKEKAIRQVIASIGLNLSSLDKNVAKLTSVLILDGDGNTLIYEFTNQKPSATLTSEQKKAFEGI